jgi:hypothetical protein
VGDRTPRRARSPRLAGDSLVATLVEQVDQLIKENRQLKRALARAETGEGGGALGQAAKTLSGLQRRISRELGADGTGGRRRRSAAATEVVKRPRRKVTDPEVLERRRQALAKAREVRRMKRLAAAAG